MRSERRRGVLRASGKAVWRWPRVVAVDASGSMQIQSCEGAVLSRAVRLCCRARPHTTPCARKLATAKKYREDCVVEEGGRRDRLEWRATKIRSDRKDAELSSWREWFHAATVTRGGDRKLGLSTAVAAARRPSLGRHTWDNSAKDQARLQWGATVLSSLRLLGWSRSN